MKITYVQFFTLKCSLDIEKNNNSFSVIFFTFVYFGLSLIFNFQERDLLKEIKAISPII